MRGGVCSARCYNKILDTHTRIKTVLQHHSIASTERTANRVYNPAYHQETPPNYKDVLFSRCLKMTCKMFYYSKRCFNFWKHLEHVQKVCKMFWNILNMFKTFVRCFKVSKYLLDVLKHLLDTQGPIKDVQSTMRCFDWKMFYFVRCW